MKVTHSDLKRFNEVAPDLVHRARALLVRLKMSGVSDIYAREMLIRHPIYKVEYADRIARRHARKNVAGYIHSILTDRRDRVARVRMYARRSLGEMTHENEWAIAKCAINFEKKDTFRVLREAIPKIREQEKPTERSIDHVFWGIYNRKRGLPDVVGFAPAV